MLSRSVFPLLLFNCRCMCGVLYFFSSSSFLTANWKILQIGFEGRELSCNFSRNIHNTSNYYQATTYKHIILRTHTYTQGNLLIMIQGIIPEKLLDAGLFLQLLNDAGYAAPPAYLTQADFQALMSRMVCKTSKTAMNQKQYYIWHFSLD